LPIGICQAVLTTGTSDALIANTPTHVLICHERVREQATADAKGELELLPGAQVRLVELVPGIEWALIARDGRRTGYVPADALAPLH